MKDTALPPLSVLVNAVNDNEKPRGPDRYLMELLPHLTDADPGLHLTVLHAPWQQRLAEALAPVAEIREAPAPRGPSARLLWQASGFVRLANAMAPDLVFLPNLIWTPGLRAPSLLTIHDLLHFTHPGKFGAVKSALLRRTIRRAMARADRAIAVSETTARAARAVLPGIAPRLKVILEGAPPRRDTAPADPADPPFFLYAGQIERTKNVPRLAEAFLSVAALSDHRLVIVGPEGNDSAALAPLIARSGGRIERPGWVTDEALDSLYRQATGFVFPSEAEGFGLVLLEAMARGAPVIAADATSLPEVAGDAALLVPPGDTAALARAMERLAADPALREGLRAAGYRRLEAFSWEEAGRRTAALMRETVRETA